MTEGRGNTSSRHNAILHFCSTGSLRILGAKFCALAIFAVLQEAVCL